MDIPCPGALAAHLRKCRSAPKMAEMEQAFGVEILHRAGCRTDGPERGGAFRIAVELYGGDCVVESARAQTEAELSHWKNQTFIVLRANLPPRRQNFAVARMVAREEMRRAGVRWDESALAAFLVAPTPAVHRCVERIGLDLPVLADAFALTQTCLAIRIPEVIGDVEGVVVTPERVYRRGLDWLIEDDVRRLAKTRPKALKKVPIVDEPGRCALYKLTG
jgi:hypothetical protein